MVNNVVDHSAGKIMSIHVIQTPNNISFSILDDGVGIFNKIQTEFGLRRPITRNFRISQRKIDY